MVLFSMIDLIHGMLHFDQKKIKMLIQNKYYVIPNVSPNSKKTNMVQLAEQDVSSIEGFLADKKSEVKFVYNFHDGVRNSYSGLSQNLQEQFPKMENMFMEIYNEAKFPSFEQIGDEFNVATPYQKLDETIVKKLGIPTVYAEIKYPKSTKGKNGLSQAESGPNSEFSILSQNNNYLSHTYEKLGT